MNSELNTINSSEVNYSESSNEYRPKRFKVNNFLYVYHLSDSHVGKDRNYKIKQNKTNCIKKH